MDSGGVNRRLSIKFARCFNLGALVREFYKRWEARVQHEYREQRRLFSMKQRFLYLEIKKKKKLDRLVGMQLKQC